MKNLLHGILMGGLLAMTAGCGIPSAEAPHMEQIVWKFDRLDAVGGMPTHVEGHPQVISTPAGKAVAFNGVDEALVIDRHPLAGATAFTIEAVFRPDGGAFEQRWLHLSEDDPVNGNAQSPRILFEVRVVGEAWYLDAFITGPGYNKALAVPERLFPLGRWYRVEQTFDGKTYRSYVDGVLQAEAELDYKPQGSGHASVGMRINRVNYFHGAILEARFTQRALRPEEFMTVPKGMNASTTGE